MMRGFYVNKQVTAVVKKVRLKKAGTEYLIDTSATRLSRGDPLGFPPHPREWLSIIVHLLLRDYAEFQNIDKNISSSGICQHINVSKCYNCVNFSFVDLIYSRSVSSG